MIDEADIEAHGPFMLYRKEDTDYNRFKRWNEKIADDPVWEEAIVDRVKLMVVTLKKHWNGQKNLIQTVSPNMRVQDIVITIKHMITAIWMCTAVCIQLFLRFRNIWTRMEANHSFW